ncbi:MAG: RNA-binding protein [Chlamydiae bacterium]|nr:RNA-binding protein [Chlamydiota bacterium]
MKLYVGNLPFSHSEEDVRRIFAAYSTVTNCTLVKDAETGRSRGFAFVELSSDDEARNAISDLHNKQVGTRALVVNEARPRESRPPRDGGRDRDDRRPFNKNRR